MALQKSQIGTHKKIQKHAPHRNGVSGAGSKLNGGLLKMAKSPFL